MTRFLSITFYTSLAISAGGLIAVMIGPSGPMASPIGAVESAPYVQIVIGVSALIATLSLFCLEQTGALNK